MQFDDKKFTFNQTNKTRTSENPLDNMGEILYGEKTREEELKKTKKKSIIKSIRR